MPDPRPRQWMDYRALEHRYADLALSIIEPDGPQNTGLLDASGNPLYRQRETIGFLRRQETN